MVVQNKHAPINEVPRLFLTKRYSVNLEKSASFKVAVTEMYPRIP